MTELEIMQHAKDYLDKLAKGIDPLTGREVPEDDIILIPNQKLTFAPAEIAPYCVAALARATARAAVDALSGTISARVSV